MDKDFIFMGFLEYNVFYWSVMSCIERTLNITEKNFNTIQLTNESDLFSKSHHNKYVSEQFVVRYFLLVVIWS